MIKKFRLFENEEVKNKKIFVLVGPPSVGKSTWIKSTFGEIQPYIINRDDLVEQVAKEYGWTYDDMFVGPPVDSKEEDVSDKYGKVIKSPEYMTWTPLSYDKVLEANGKVSNLFNKRVADAKGKDNIVVDMTNMNAGARKGSLKPIEGSEHEYHKVAVVFNFKGAEDLIKKVALKRAEDAKKMGKSKTIPEAAFDRMFKSFQEISKEEGFDEVINVDNTEGLKKSIESSESKPQVTESKSNMKYIKTFESFKIFENIEDAEINADDDELNGTYCADFTPSELKKDEIIYNIIVDVDENEHRWAKNPDEVEVHGMASHSTPSKYKVISNDGKEVKIEEIK